MPRTMDDSYLVNLCRPSYKVDRCWPKTIPWGVHPYQEIVGTKEQIQDIKTYRKFFKDSRMKFIRSESFEGFKLFIIFITPLFET